MSAATLSAIPAVAYALPVIALVAVFIVGASVKILRESERAVVFKLSRFQRVKGPGVVLLIPFIQEMVSETSR